MFYVYICRMFCLLVCKCPHRLEESVRSTSTGTTDLVKSHMVLGTESRSSESSQPKFHFKNELFVGGGDLARLLQRTRVSSMHKEAHNHFNFNPMEPVPSSDPYRYIHGVKTSIHINNEINPNSLLRKERKMKHWK